MPACKTAVVVLLVITSLSTGLCETVISGDVSKIVFDPANNPFIVATDIKVPENTVTVINAGCILLFSPFCGLTVSGSLLVKGTAEKPVIFTSPKDTSVNNHRDSLAASFDWNGIYIKPDADSIRMSNFELRYSVFGIKTQTKNIIIKNGLFKANGQFHFSINDKLQLVQDNIPFSYPSEQSIETVPVQRSNSLTITSAPSDAEVYINRKPGKKIRRDGNTPILLPRSIGPSIAVTLFKKSFNDTTLTIDLVKTADKIDIALAPLSPDRAPKQTIFLKERLRVRIGLGCLIATPVFIAGGSALSYFAHNERDDANEAADFLNTTILPRSDPEYQQQKKIYDEATGRADIRRNSAIALIGVAAATLAVGVMLYW